MKRSLMSLLTIAGLTVAGLAEAGPKPADAQKANPQEIANFWAGKTNTWRDCKGGIYYGPNWQAVAWCEKNGPAVGIGRWQVDRNGTICHELTWYWPEDGGRVGSDQNEITDRNCDQSVQTADGTIYTRWKEKKNDPDAWWRPATSDAVRPGFDREIKRKINRLRRKLDV